MHTMVRQLSVYNQSTDTETRNKKGQESPGSSAHSQLIYRTEKTALVICGSREKSI